MAAFKDTPPAPGSSMTLEIKNLPVKLWWKLMETARIKKVSVEYLLFRTLVDALKYDDQGESYDLVLEVIEKELNDCD